MHITRVILNLWERLKQLSVAYTLPKLRYVSEELVASLEQDRLSVGTLLAYTNGNHADILSFSKLHGSTKVSF